MAARSSRDSSRSRSALQGSSDSAAPNGWCCHTLPSRHRQITELMHRDSQICSIDAQSRTTDGVMNEFIFATILPTFDTIRHIFATPLGQWALATFAQLLLSGCILGPHQQPERNEWQEKADVMSESSASGYHGYKGNNGHSEFPTR